MDRLSPLFGEAVKSDRPVVHRGILPTHSTSVLTSDRRSGTGQVPNTITNGMESYLRNLDERKKDLKTEWRNTNFQSSRSNNDLPQLSADTLDTKFHQISKLKSHKNKISSPTHHQSRNLNENETSVRRFHTPLLDMPTPTRGEVAELESAIGSSPYNRIREWQTEALSETAEISDKWELRHWHLLEYWYEFHENDVEAATRSFYEHESSVKETDNGETGSTSIHEKSSTASINSSFNRLWNDDKSYFNRQQQLPTRPSYMRRKLQPDWQEMNSNKLLASPTINSSVSDRQKRQPELKEITPERELTPPSYDSKYNEIPEPQSYLDKRLLEPVDDGKKYPYPSNSPSATTLITPPNRKNHLSSSRIMHNVDQNIKEEEEEPNLSDTSNGSISRVKVHWYEDPAATPRRGHVRQLLKHLEKGLPMDGSEFDHNIPVYSSKSTPT
ncbi:hypothetical protein INT43_001988 [Umbelopsis isabellina]|uniref:Uncharacterized protein n=1 Tax=Mortierella isabellina TaxID=91625 RepID=A0A8H7UGL3_MORIS|nr:hypothetical protein INT43_001988 [Umbelopsis isabellina]